MARQSATLSSATQSATHLIPNCFKTTKKKTKKEKTINQKPFTNHNNQQAAYETEKRTKDRAVDTKFTTIMLIVTRVSEFPSNGPITGRCHPFVTADDKKC